MSSKEEKKLDSAIKNIRNKSKHKHGIICLNGFFIYSKIEEIINFMESNGIVIPEGNANTRLEYLKRVCAHFYEKYYNDDGIKKNYLDPINYLGDMILKDEHLANYVKNFDFISKHDLIDIFADFCASLDNTVYDLSMQVNEILIDLYLIRKKPSLRTEAIIVRTGHQLDENSYEEALKALDNAREVALNRIFVTTPYGIYKVGFEKLISDLEERNIWLYVVDPFRELLFGIIKGKKSNEFNEIKRDEFIKSLPKKPLRAPSQIIDESRFSFDSSTAYNLKEFGLYELLSEIDHNKLILKPEKVPKYAKIFRDLIIMDHNSGILLVSYSSKDFKEHALTSGFLSAMDTFISQIGGSRMQEINYKGFYIQAAYGKYTKVVCFLAEPADENFRERLNFLINEFEKIYEDKIKLFQKNGDTEFFEKEEIQNFVKSILDI